MDGTTEAGSFAFLPSGTSRPGFGFREALIPFTAPAFFAKAAIDRLAAPPAGDAVSTASASAAPAKAAMVRAVRTSDLLGRLRVGLLKYRQEPGFACFVCVSAQPRRSFAEEAPGYHESSERTHSRGTRKARRAELLRAASARTPRVAVAVPAQAGRAVRRGRSAAPQVRRRPAQVQVPLLDVRVGRVLRLVRRLVVRARPRLPALRARDGTRARGEAPGAPGQRPALHPVPGRADHTEADAAQRLERGEARDRGPDPRLTRSSG